MSIRTTDLEGMKSLFATLTDFPAMLNSHSKKRRKFARKHFEDFIYPKMIKLSESEELSDLDIESERIIAEYLKMIRKGEYDSASKYARECLSQLNFISPSYYCY